MARIGSALSGIERQLLSSLAMSNAEATLSSFRMATGHMINSPSDDPSAFITLSGLQSQLSNVTATLSNVTAAGSMIGQTHTALGGIQTQLNTIRTELLKDADRANPLTDVQRAESQAKIDAAIDQINTLAGTSINGKMLLGGSADYIYSGRNTSQVADVIVRSKVPSGSTISGSVTTTATQAYLSYTGASGNVTASAVFTLTGERGSQVVSVSNGEALTSVRDKINNDSYNTGITAAIDGLNSNKLIFTSVDYGSSASVNISVTSGTFNIDSGGQPTGTNASAVINGQTIGSDSSNVSGNRFTVNDNGSTFQIEFQPNLAPATTFDTITVEGNNLNFALSPESNISSSLTIPAVNSADFSGPSGNLNDLYSGGSSSGLGDNTAQAIRIVDESLGQLLQVQGAVDGFYNSAITSSSGLLSDMQTKLGKYVDSIDKVNDTEQTSRRDYYRALASNAQSGLMILNQQRMGIVNMLQEIAGLYQT